MALLVWTPGLLARNPSTTSVCLVRARRCGVAVEHVQHPADAIITQTRRCNGPRRRQAYLVGLSSERVQQIVRIRLYPSDLSYRWSGCRLCFWLKCRYGVALRTPFPEVFNHIDAAMKEAYHGQNLRAVAKVPEDWPDGIVDCSAAVEQVRSQEFQLARHPWVRFTITGRIDALVRFTDETFGVIDFKASRLEASKLQETYAMQLQAYAFALEHPAWGSTDDDDDDDDNHNNKDSPVASSEFGHPSVTQLALLAFRPERFEIKKHHQESHLCGYSELIPVERDDDGFYDLLRQIAEMMESPTPPEPSESCGACSFYAARYPFQS